MRGHSLILSGHDHAQADSQGLPDELRGGGEFRRPGPLPAVQGCGPEPSLSGRPGHTIRASIVGCLLEASAKTAGVELATRYLTTTDRPLAEVADLLGFSGLSALSRWFSGRFGCIASVWRAAHRGGMVPAR